MESASKLLTLLAFVLGTFTLIELPTAFGLPLSNDLEQSKEDVMARAKRISNHFPLLPSPDGHHPQQQQQLQQLQEPGKAEELSARRAVAEPKSDDMQTAEFFRSYPGAGGSGDYRMGMGSGLFGNFDGGYGMGGMYGGMMGGMYGGMPSPYHHRYPGAGMYPGMYGYDRPAFGYGYGDGISAGYYG